MADLTVLFDACVLYRAPLRDLLMRLATMGLFRARWLAAIHLPDPDDRHVLAAGITGWADLIVTKNWKDFPADCLAPFSICAKHPDVSIRSLLDLNEAATHAAVARHRASFRHPPKSVEEYLDTLLVQKLPDPVAALQLHRDRIQRASPENRKWRLAGFVAHRFRV